jgi:hypothetical protein
MSDFSLTLKFRSPTRVDALLDGTYSQESALSCLQIFVGCFSFEPIDGNPIFLSWNYCKGDVTIEDGHLVIDHTYSGLDEFAKENFYTDPDFPTTIKGLLEYATALGIPIPEGIGEDRLYSVLLSNLTSHYLNIDRLALSQVHGYYLNYHIEDTLTDEDFDVEWAERVEAEKPYFALTEVTFRNRDRTLSLPQFELARFNSNNEFNCYYKDENVGWAKGV